MSHLSEHSWKRRTDLRIDFKYVGDGGWRCRVCNAYARSYKNAKTHEFQCLGQIRDSSLQATPIVTPYTGQNAVDTLLSSNRWADSSWREGPEAVVWDSEAGSSHGLLDDRGEGNSNATSTHREETVLEQNLTSDRQVATRVTPHTGQNAVDTLLSSQWWRGSSTRNVASLFEGLEVAERDLEAGSLRGLLDD